MKDLSKVQSLNRRNLRIPDISMLFALYLKWESYDSMARTMVSNKVTDFWKETISHQANHLYRVWLKIFLGQIILQHYGDNITLLHYGSHYCSTSKKCSFKVLWSIPDSMLCILLFPVIKDKAGLVSCLDDYRPTTLASILSKVLERILLDKVCISLLWIISLVSSMVSTYVYVDLRKQWTCIGPKIHQSSCVLLMCVKLLIEQTTGNYW